ncbi:hypothetical protein R1sor_026278 [Riccia sorocarpa]|uniref:Uncharacterized protein n=1 Tax=Riccia sorocarpa TaxID=122646 RepID=A0ABD3GE83_9MARC
MVSYELFRYNEGRGASGGSLSSYSGKASSDGGYYHNKNLDGPYQSHSGGGNLGELDQDLDGVYEEKGFHAQTLEELEQRFLQETIELTKDQNMDEDKEKAKHRERMNKIHEQYQQRLSVLRSKHM